MPPQSRGSPPKPPRGFSDPRSAPPTLAPFLDNLPSPASTISDQRNPTANGYADHPIPISPTSNRLRRTTITNRNENKNDDKNENDDGDNQDLSDYDPNLDDADFQSHYSISAENSDPDTGSPASEEEDAHNLSLHLSAPTHQLPTACNIGAIAARSTTTAPALPALLQPSTNAAAALAEPDLAPPTAQPAQPLDDLDAAHDARLERRGNAQRHGGGGGAIGAARDRRVARVAQGADLRILRLRALPGLVAGLRALPALVVPAVALPRRHRPPLLPEPLVVAGHPVVSGHVDRLHLRGVAELQCREYLTLPMASVECMVDEAANIAVVDAKGRLRKGGSKMDLRSASSGNGSWGRNSGGLAVMMTATGGGNNGQRRWGGGAGGTTEKIQWRNLWNEGTDAVMDIPIGGVCEVLYGDGRDADGI
ncbi:hypothetical protein EPUS_04057 [Endocarpon pusillum Z07020]|uniref:Uncharacterized protein n=1 Tax=Endocarpon pusillum (strain Z07020 / HMAS-L-300199) TaxID=1263415 RepID=U1HVN6_ENDPU|nr:uncharacterized protein EPUS_04057 [Endocarpon pusillum Z07020]ERF73434.1 hypothetical protein EPUS_04057 [Endocarpon pusillum Z07020]